MKERIEKIFYIVFSIVFSIYALLAIILLLFLPKYNILFPGWWTFIILLPSLGSLLFKNNKLNSSYLFIIGILLLLWSLKIMSFYKCFTIFLCLGIIVIGVHIVLSILKISENKLHIHNSFPFYYTFLGSTEEKIGIQFQNGESKVLFGYLSLDLRYAKIEKDAILKVFSLFGETEIFLPEDVEVIISNTNILGGTENIRNFKKNTLKKKGSKITIESMSIFGSTKIK